MIKSHLLLGDYKLNLLTLTFSKEVEQAFKDEHFKKSLQHVRVALLLSIAFFGFFGVLDAWIVYEVKYQIWFIRYAVFCPYAFAMYLLSYSDQFKNYMQIGIASVMVVAGLGIVAMILVAPHANNSYYAGLILVFIFGYTFFKLDFIYAAAAGFLIVIAYEVAAIGWSQTPVAILVSNNFFFLSGNILGMFACYSIELSSRKEYVQARLLESEKKKVHQANLELENKVEQRTGQLLKANKVLKQEIAERNRAEELVRESEEKYRSILQSMEEGYYELDIAGNLKFFNDAFFRIVGYPMEELNGSHYRLFTDPQDVDNVFRAFNNVYVSHKPSKGFKWQILRKDGEKRHLESSVSLIRNSENLPNGFRGVVRDVTDRNLAEESLQKAYQELKYTQSQLVQSAKLASIGELAAGVAHELNQPLMVIRGNAQLIQRNISKGKIKMEDMLQQMEPIERNTKRMMNIINHLRTFSRQSKTDFYPLDINKVIEDSFMMVGEQLRLRNIEIVRSLDRELPPVKGEANQLEQVFLNLITNARDAIADKEQEQGTQNGDRNRIEIITRLSEENSQFVEIVLKDSGNGIKKQDQAKIFDPFYTTKEVGKGTGLGLSISYGIICDHNGKIEIAETGPDGTTFTVRLPIADTKSGGQPAEEECLRKIA